MKPSKISFLYKNKSEEPVEVWLSAAPGTEGITFGDEEPISIHEDNVLGSLYYFKVPAKKTVSYEAEYKEAARYELKQDEFQYFLRSTELIPVNEETKRHAEELTSSFDSDADKVRAIFEHVRKSFTYTSRLKERGFQQCVRNKKGDCGELSAVIASYCRSIQIPCRVMVGSFRGKFQPHAWNEVYLKGRGWIAMDVSLAMYTFLRHPLRNIGATVRWGALSNKQRYTEEIEEGRVVFSIDPERKLYPIYRNKSTAVKDSVYKVGAKDLAWGFESMDGAAPYMQPIYPRLNESYAAVKTKDLLGTYKITPKNKIDYYSYLIKIQSFFLAALLIYFSLIATYMQLEPPIWIMNTIESVTAILLGIFSLLTFIRKEYNFPILVLCVLFAFSVVGFLYGLV